MTEKQIVTDPEVAKNIQDRLIDPREIKAIILTTTQDEPTIRGFATQEGMAISAWASTNNTCYAILDSLPQPQISIHIGPGTGIDGRSQVATDFIKSLIDRWPSDKPKAVAFVQSKGVPQYPTGRSGPRAFQLITICGSAKAQKHEVRFLEDDQALLPEYDAAGRQLVEFRVVDISAKSSARATSDISSSPTTEQPFRTGSKKKWYEFWK